MNGLAIYFVASWWSQTWAYVLDNAGPLSAKTVEHLLWLTLIPVVAAIAIGVPLGVIVHRFGWLRGATLGAAGVIQTIPSLAMLALLQIILGTIGKFPAIIALTLYALLPIIRNTATGLAGVPDSVVEAARGMGFTRRQRLTMVELPLAVPVIVAGIRTSAVIVVGIATLATLIGAGGLGDFIVEGLSLDNAKTIMLGVVPAAMLALIVDGAFGIIEKLLRRGRPNG
jgi:osmoprotectant transport system permease protein